MILKILLLQILLFARPAFLLSPYVIHTDQTVATRDLKERIANYHIAWDSASLIRLSDPGQAAFYPRMIQLKDWSLLLAFASKGNIITRKSHDNGRSWTKAIIAAQGKDDVNEDTPELLELSNGNILIFYNSRPHNKSDNAADKHAFDIRVKTSSDKGENWQNEQVLYEGGTSFKNGCWEPAALQLPDGAIQLFFSNEAIYTSSDEQNISMLQSKDGGLTFTKNPEIISFRKGSRDGMPVPVWLAKSQKIVLAIEDPGYKNFKPYIIRSDHNGVWNRVIGGEDVDRRYTLHNKINDSVYAGAPYLRQLSNGITILSYQSTEGRKINKDNNAVMHVAIGNDDATDFYEDSTPFTVPEGLHALWNSLCVLRGDTIVALTSTNAFAGAGSEIWMIKGVLMRK